MDLVADSNIFIRASRPTEVGHADAKEFFSEAHRRGDIVHTPITVLVDIGADIDHPFKRPKGSPFVEPFTITNSVKFVNVDFNLFERGWKPDLRIPVKGPDRILICCAVMLKATLITEDKKLLKYAPKAGVTVLTPKEYLGVGK